MSEHILNIADNFWNIRGDFKIGGIINIGTHASIVRCKNGKFVLLDAYTLQGKLKNQVDALTNNGADLDAIINLHPFHTIHVQKVHESYPNAKLYGTQRHLDKFPDLPWQAQLTESNEFAALFADDFEFSVPAGVDFISANENLHFSSVLAYHKASKTIHADDTLMYLKFPSIIGVLKKPQISFHMTLAQTLEKRAGAATDFRNWAIQLTQQWTDAENLCAAHSSSLLGSKNLSPSIADKILAALQKVERTLQAHEKKFG
ncbi:hypothetical protein PE36_18730 [Moritella sp. PE36]|uniref:hypothetical protein n=1 Tax=Moritella sp. PE36 TaxID=58051 RepID=UPI0001568665|nr:hypothetical protein [Moritella sp. PE36]EDM67874.1 hypothetical protein PE36_18730 [Moritella sp. PE36]